MVFLTDLLATGKRKEVLTVLAGIIFTKHNLRVMLNRWFIIQLC